ncbi:MAG: helix-turn-helix domain-containing protein [Cyclobacteriaceae bacterium]
MIWSVLFEVSIAQGVFLISLIAIRGSKNPIASRLINILLFVMVLTNLGYLTGLTGVRNSIPQLFGIPFGMMLLIGPVFYLYSRSVIDNSFTWKNRYLIHFIPYLVQVLLNLPLFFMTKGNWVGFIDFFLSGEMTIGKMEMVVFFIQDVQLFIYLLLTFRWIKTAMSNQGSPQYIISLSARIKWVRVLAFCFTVFLVTVFLLYIFTLLSGKYNPVANYLYTLVTSGIIYFVAYKLVLNPELISPDFTQKYRAYMQFLGEDGEGYLQKLKLLMTETKIFTDPELKLSLLARQLGLPSHQVSKLINEKFGKSFNDYVNEYRVSEFIQRINNPEFKSLSIYGLALDVGFNSKSSFNTAFKKITGKTPSAYKDIS